VIKIITFFFFYTNITLSCEFVHPVAIDSKTKYIFLVHTYKNQSELLVYNPNDNKIQEIINRSKINFWDFKVIPDTQNFSFQDNGIIRIGSLENNILNKINFSEPIYNISFINWINKNEFYFSAKKGNKSFIALMNIDNNCIETVLEDEEEEIFFPQKVDSQYFYISKYTDTKFRKHKSFYKIFVMNHKVKKLVYNFEKTPIFFLNMIGPDEGFVIEYEKNIDEFANTINFFCHRLKKEGEDWYSEKIFTFALPLLVKESEMSILPFLPLFLSKKIFFCNYDQNNLNIDIYCFDVLKKIIHKKTSAKYMQIFFSPKLFENKIYYGNLFRDNNKLDLNDFKNQFFSF